MACGNDGCRANFDESIAFALTPSRSMKCYENCSETTDLQRTDEVSLILAAEECRPTNSTPFTSSPSMTKGSSGS